MALFKVNTGTREQEVCRLQRDREIAIPELDTSVFVVPGELVKNKVDRLIVLNNVARSVIDGVRGQHPVRVFAYKGRPLARIGNSSWQRARWRAAARYEVEIGAACPEGFRRCLVHDLKHSHGRRLRAAGVSFEDRQDLLGHKSGKVTTEYSAPELANLTEAANRFAAGEKTQTSDPRLRMLKLQSNLLFSLKMCCGCSLHY